MTVKLTVNGNLVNLYTISLTKKKKPDERHVNEVKIAEKRDWY